MKLVREHINEKFSEESDPIRDMGIGVFSKHNFSTGQEALNFVWAVLPAIFKGEIPKDIIDDGDGIGFFGWGYGLTIKEYLDKYIYVNNHNIYDYNNSRDFNMWQFNNALHNALIRAGYSLSKKTRKSKIFKKPEYKDLPELKINN